jgi:hypothetical protein
MRSHLWPSHWSTTAQALARPIWSSYKPGLVLSLTRTSQRVPVPPGIFAIWDGMGSGRSHLDFWTLDVSSLDTFKCRIGGGVALVTRKTNEGPPHAKL